MNDGKTYEAIFIRKGIFSNIRLSKVMDKQKLIPAKINNLVLGEYNTLVHSSPKKVVKIINRNKDILNVNPATIPIFNDFNEVFSHYKSSERHLNLNKYKKENINVNLKNKSMRETLFQSDTLPKISRKLLIPKKNAPEGYNYRLSSQANLDESNQHYKYRSKFNIKEKENFRIRLQTKLKLKLKYPEASNKSHSIKDTSFSVEQLKKALQKMNSKRKNYIRNESKYFSGYNPLVQKIQEAKSEILLKKRLSKEQKILNNYKDYRSKLRKSNQLKKINKAHSLSFHQNSILIRGIRLNNINESID